MVGVIAIETERIFVVSDFFSAEVSPEIMEVKTKRGFLTQKKCPFHMSRGHSSR